MWPGSRRIFCETGWLHLYFGLPETLWHTVLQLWWIHWGRSGLGTGQNLSPRLFCVCCLQVCFLHEVVFHFKSRFWKPNARCSNLQPVDGGGKKKKMFSIIHSLKSSRIWKKNCKFWVPLFFQMLFLFYGVLCVRFSKYLRNCHWLYCQTFCHKCCFISPVSANLSFVDWRYKGCKCRWPSWGDTVLIDLNQSFTVLLPRNSNSHLKRDRKVLDPQALVYVLYFTEDFKQPWRWQVTQHTEFLPTPGSLL